MEFDTPVLTDTVVSYVLQERPWQKPQSLDLIVDGEGQS